jgi:hypothetical protein
VYVFVYAHKRGQYNIIIILRRRMTLVRRKGRHLTLRNDTQDFINRARRHLPKCDENGTLQFS